MFSNTLKATGKLKGTVHHSEVRSGKNYTVQISARKFSTTYNWKFAEGEDNKELK